MESRAMRILAIDDNQDNLTILKTLILEAFQDARVFTALNGQKGLDIAASEEPDIILLDIIMHGMDGYEVCRRLKADEQLCDIPVVFVTAIKSDKESRILALECGAEAFLTKPIDASELTAQIRAMARIRLSNIQKRDEVQYLDLQVKEKTRALKESNTKLRRTITRERLIARELERNQKLTEATLASVGDAVISTDINGCIQFLNSVAEKLTGWTQEEARGHEVEEIFDIQNEMTGIKCESIARLVLETGNIEGLANHTVLLSRQGDKHPIEDCAAPIIMENGEICGIVIVFRDCTAKRERMQEIEFLSYHDPLTGLYNRRFFEEEMRRNDVPRNIPISIIMADINGLKQINDSFGHSVGDELLKAAAQIIKKTCRADDIVARLGGDEFVILLPQTSSDDADMLVKRIKMELRDERIMGIPISLSFGYETKTQEQETIYGVLNLSEDHMYRHKLNEATSIKNKNVELIINALYAKNQREMRHSLRVAELSSQISEAMGLSADEINQIKTAGLLHDIGKIGISDEILNKAERLNDKEWEEIRKHSEIGYRILKASPDFAEVANFVFEHQEKWDGTGYPRGLAGSEISLAARIVAVADAFDAMTGERTYGRVHSKQDAIIEIQRRAGTQFDPEIADLFANQVLNQRTEV